jgi:Ca2+-binding RTX toxin-like protein
MAKIIIDTPSPGSAAALRDALNDPQNAYNAVTSAQSTVEVGINNRTDAALDLLAGILTSLPWYDAPGSGTALAETLKQTARIVDGKRRDRQIEEAVNGPADYGTVDPRTNTSWNGAKQWQPRRDPLTFDLDGDGLETVGVSSTNPILFDHDGDGTKNGTGWVSGDDAFLVIDKNGNGTIDSGLELFGDSTVKSNGLNATDGFDALADLDSNADGVVNNQDTQFTNLKLWRDLNQDGESQAGELFTLNDLGIIGINVASTEHSTTLANGNQLADTGSFIKADGSTGTVGEVTGSLGDINLADDTFHREFTDQLDTTAVASLPDMQGSGAVRDLREAATQSTVLQSLLTQYSAATTRAEQMALIDQMMDAWADTSGYAESYADRIVGLTYTLSDPGAGPSTVPYIVSYEAFGTITNATYLTEGTSTTSSGGSGGGGTISTAAELTPEYQALINSWNQKIHILEAFNGSYFFGLPTQPNEGAKTGISLGTANNNGGSVTIITAMPIEIRYDQTQLDLLQQSYDVLKASVYDALLLQTRFKPLLDEVNLVIDSTGIHLDFSQLTQTLQQNINTNAVDGIADLIDFSRSSQSMLQGTGWAGNQLLEQTLRNTSITPALQALYDQFHITFADPASSTQSSYMNQGTSKADIMLNGDSTNFTTGGVGNDTLFGGNATDYLYGNDDNDILIGNQGDDHLNGDNGDDVLQGGSGNDHLYGGDGSDIYLFDRGDGQDTIHNYGSDANSGKIDQIFMGSLNLNDVNITRVGEDLVLTVKNSTDTLRVENYFSQDATDAYAVESIQFADATLNIADIKAYVLIASENEDSMTGYAGNDTLAGLAGNDSIYGHAGNDVLEGDAGSDTLSGDAGDDILHAGTGNDVLNGGEGNDLLQGQQGNDYLYGDTGSDTLEGGAGNDVLNGGDGADVYLFGKGSGQDTIHNYDGDALGNNADTILLGAGITAADVTLTRASNNLYLNINGTNDRLEVTDYFYENGLLPYVVENIQFADGTTWDIATVSNMVMQATTGDDNVTGTAADDLLSGGDGNDTINANDGADTLEGDAGTDYLYGNAGNDTIKGGLDQDSLMGNEGDDVLYGQQGNDYLYGDAGNDTLDGGAGYDYLSGGDGADIYLFGKGSGQDTIHNYDGDAIGTNADTIQLGADIAVADVTLTRGGSSLYISINGTGDRLEVANYFYENGTLPYVVENIQFADGTTWDIATVNQLVMQATAGDDNITGTMTDDVLAGGDGNDSINGSDGADALEGNAGNDYLYGNAGNDTVIAGVGNDQLYGGDDNDVLLGQQGNDYLYGDAGNDTLEGGAGYDYLIGGDGADIYLFGRGAGQDVIYNNDSDALGTNADTIQLGADITVADVTLTRASSSLYISINGTSDRLEVSSYFNQDGVTPHTVENIQFADGTIWDVATVKEKVMVGTEADDEVSGFASNDVLSAGNGNDIIYGNEGSDTLDGGTGRDTLYGGVDNDTLLGQSGNDTLDGGSGDDILDGGAGNDVQYGSDGADTYLFGKGSGQDTIYNYDADAQGTNADAIQLGTGITTTDVTFTRSGDSLSININNSNDRLEVANYFYQEGSSPYNIESILFADGTSWNYSQVLSNVTEVIPVAGVEVSGTGADELLVGLQGNDVLYGYEGNDTLDGGAGNDYLTGGEGADIYLFGKGSGQDSINNSDSDALGTNADTIRLGADITVADVTLTRGSDSLYISINGTSDRLEVSSYFHQDGVSPYAVENIQFADGTIWDIATVKNKVIDGTANDDNLTAFAGNDVVSGLAGDDTMNGYTGDDVLDGGVGADRIFGGEGNDTLLGGSQNDTLYGDTGDDILNGGTGNDYLTGDSGADTYLFGRGYGQDAINNYDSDALGTNADAIQLGAGIVASDVTFARSGDSLVISINGSNDRLEVSSYFNEDGTYPYAVENILFADGTIWDIATVKSKVIVGSAEDDNVTGYATNDNLSGLAGDDTLNGNLGDDTLEGGVGADQLSGGEGDDILNGGAQNDMLYGGAGSDVLEGESGDDTLYGGADNDTLDGGIGNDSLTGGEGADTYLFGKGSGQDVINNYDGDEMGTNVDTILLGAGITTSDVTLTSSGDSLYININGTNDRLEVSNYFYADGTLPYAVENIQFADGTVWNLDNVKSSLLVATSGDDVVRGFNTDDTLNGLVGNDTLYGLAGNDILAGGAGNDTLQGQEGNDELNGGAQNDYLYGGVGNDLLQGDEGSDYLQAGEGDDILNGGAGNDYLIGDVGADTYLFGKGSGQDTINNYDGDALGSNADIIQLGADIVVSDMALTRSGDSLIISINGTGDRLEVSGYFYENGTLPYAVENIQFADGTTWDVATVKSMVLQSTLDNDTITGYTDSDVLSGDLGNDYISGASGNDIIDGGADEDQLNGNDGDDFIKGGTQNDSLDGGVGNDILLGQNGKDSLYDNAGNDMLDGGAGDDTLQSYGVGSSILVGGTGNDNLYVSGDHDVLAFNKGDGQDVVNSYSATNATISLGGAIDYADLNLSKSGNDLILKTTSSDQIVFSSWYSSPNSVINLQVVAEAMAGFDANGTNVLLDNNIETFNFADIVAQFDAEGATANWQLTDARLTAHLNAGSDAAAIGGDLAYQYGKNSTLTGMGLTNAQSVIGAANFGQTAQTLNNPSVWQAEVIKLG